MKIEYAAQKIFEEKMARNFPTLTKDWFRKLDEPQMGYFRKEHIWTKHQEYITEWIVSLSSQSLQSKRKDKH